MESILCEFEYEMESNCNKKLRTDYSSLLKCWSIIKSSELIIEKGYQELKRFKANINDKAIHRLISTLESHSQRNEYKSSFDQTIILWNKTIDQFIHQSNYFAAAECLENLAEIELKFGKEDNKKESINKLVKAAQYYSRSNEHNLSISAFKRAIIIAESTQRIDFNLIVKSYEHCSHLYEKLNLHHLAKINQKISKLFDREHKSFTFQQKMSENTSRASTPSTIPIVSEDEESLDFEKSVELNMNGEYESSSDSSNSNTSLKYDCNKKREMPFAVRNETACCSRTSLMSCVFNDSMKTTKHLKNKINSNKLLRQNLRHISNSSNSMNFCDSYDSEDSNESAFNKLIKQSTHCVTKQLLNRNESQRNQNQNYVQSEQLLKSGKRKLKPKENSEELPEKRLIKLMREGLTHNFVIDMFCPLKKLLCTVCNESLLSYRWSIITDHLKSQKHKEFLDKKEPKNVNVLTQSINNDFNIEGSQSDQNRGQIANYGNNVESVDHQFYEYCEQNYESLAIDNNNQKIYPSLGGVPAIVNTPEPQSIDSPFY